MPDGKRAHQELMDSAYRALEHPKSLSAHELSPHWRGEAAPQRKIGLWGPLALAAGAAAVVLLVVYLIARLVLVQTGGPAMAALRAVNPDQPMRLSRAAPAATPMASSQAERLRQFLAPEIAQHLVTVDEDAASVRVRTTVGELFQSGSDQLTAGRKPLFDRIAAALETEPGPVRIEGHADSDRVSGLAFPDNFALSSARADVVAAMIKAGLSDPARVSAEGYGDGQPIASNATAEGKAQNRRVEIVIERRG
jgi:type VI secretion system protein ImpK